MLHLKIRKQSVGYLETFKVQEILGWTILNSQYLILMIYKNIIPVVLPAGKVCIS